MPETISILLLEDSALDADLTLEELSAGGIEHDTRIVDTRDAFVRELKERMPDVILSDFSLPGFNGMAALDLAQECCPDVPFIFVSGVTGEEIAVESLKRGATDYILKHRLRVLPAAVRRALRDAETRREKQRAEKELARHAAEVMALNEDLRQFTYAASHDLQEPLRMVTVYTQLLALHFREQTTEKTARYFSFVETGTQRMGALLRDLVAYLHLQTSELTFAPVCMDDVLKKALTILDVSIREAGAVIEADRLPTVQGEPSQLEQVLQNLIGNALKYRGSDPPRIGITARREGPCWLFEVRDNGIGFDVKYAEQIFGLFKRLNPAEHPGTGLGLPICRRILERHGGRIWARSELGAGSVFSFSLPDTQIVPAGNTRSFESAA